MKELFKNIWSGWKELAKYFGDFQSRWILTVFYFTIVFPFGVVARSVMDPLGIRTPPEGSNWYTKEPITGTVDAAERPF